MIAAVKCFWLRSRLGYALQRVATWPFILYKFGPWWTPPCRGCVLMRLLGHRGLLTSHVWVRCWCELIRAQTKSCMCIQNDTRLMHEFARKWGSTILEPRFRANSTDMMHSKLVQARHGHPVPVPAFFVDTCNRHAKQRLPKTNAFRHAKLCGVPEAEGPMHLPGSASGMPAMRLARHPVHRSAVTRAGHWVVGGPVVPRRRAAEAAACRH